MGSRAGRRALWSVWREIGRLGRFAFAGVVISAGVAVSLGFLIPAAVRDHLMTARIAELERAVDTVAAFAPAELNVDSDLTEFGEVTRLWLLGGDTVRVKLWDPLGRIVWSDEERWIGQRFDERGDLRAAFDGFVTVEETDLDDVENEYDQGFGRLVEFYLPLRDSAGVVIGVFEVYQRLEPLETTLASVRLSTWVRIGTGLGVLTLFMGALTLATLQGAERRRHQTDALLTKSLAVREAERVRLADAMHDDIGQPLYRLLYGLDALADTRLDPSAITTEAERLARLVRQIDSTLRDELRRLQTSPVEEQGLETALRQLERDPSEGPRIEVNLETDGVGLDGASREAIYRVGREAVANATRHSGAALVTLTLTRHGADVRLEVADDGQWRSAPEGLGITGMRRLLAACGGELRIRTGRNGGTTVVAMVPMERVP